MNSATSAAVLATYTGVGQEGNRCPWVGETGANAEYDPCTASTAPDCLNSGTCIRDPINRTLAKCECPSGYNGENCEVYTGIGCEEGGNCCEARNPSSN